MSTTIGSNFDYKGPRFLDDRQGVPEKIEDLKNWDILVPEGFEVFVDGKWYIYDSETNDPNTGHFIPLLVDKLGNSDKSSVSQKGITEIITDINNSLTEIESVLWPLEFSYFNGGGTYEIGQSVSVSITWAVRRKGQEATPTEVLVNSSTSGVASNKLSYTSSTPITADKTYTIIVSVGRLSVSRSTSYIFRNKRYFGTSPKATLTTSDILGFTSDFGTNNKMSARNFNCSGGKYPWFCIPTSIYHNYPFECWIGGLKNTDLVITTQDVTNNYGHTTNYTCIRLGNIQNGNISIELK